MPTPSRTPRSPATRPHLFRYGRVILQRVPPFPSGSRRQPLQIGRASFTPSGRGHHHDQNNNTVGSACGQWVSNQGLYGEIPGQGRGRGRRGWALERSQRTSVEYKQGSNRSFSGHQIQLQCQGQKWRGGLRLVARQVWPYQAWSCTDSLGHYRRRVARCELVCAIRRQLHPKLQGAVQADHGVDMDERGVVRRPALWRHAV